MNGDLCRRAAEAFINALSCYLHSNAKRTLQIASLTGQDKVKVSLRALMRCHDPSLGFARIEDVLNILTRCDGNSWVRKLGWDYIFIEKEFYFVIPIENLRELIETDKNKLRLILLKNLT